MTGDSAPLALPHHRFRDATDGFLEVLPVPKETGSITAPLQMVGSKLYCAPLATFHNCTLQILIHPYALSVLAAQRHCVVQACGGGLR